MNEKFSDLSSSSIEILVLMVDDHGGCCAGVVYNYCVFNLLCRALTAPLLSVDQHIISFATRPSWLNVN